MFSSIDHLPLVQTAAPVHTCYVDRIATIEILSPGANCRVTYCVLRTIGGMLVRVPALELIRPIASYIPGELQELLRRAREEAARAMH